MRTAISRLRLYEPRSLGEALRLLRREGPMMPLAGGTDVYVSLNFGTLAGTRFLSLWDLDELRGTAVRGGTLTIEALTTCTEIIASRVVARRLPMLIQACREVGAMQIQNRATIGGNLANGSPAGDTLPVLAAADATIVLQNLDGIRRVPFGRFYTGYRQNVMQPDELIVSVEIPPVAGVQWFRKVGTRAAQSISKVVMAAVRDSRPRIALGSVAPTVVRATGTEACLAAGGTLDEAVAILQAEIAPIDDFRSTEAYRRAVAGNLLRAFWRDTTPPRPA